MTLLCVGVLTAAGLATYLGARAALHRNLDSALLSIARAEIASAIDEPDGEVHVHDEEEQAGLFLSGTSGYEKFAQIENPRDEIVARTHNLRDAPLVGDPVPEAGARAGIVAFGDIRRGGENLRILYYPLHDAKGRPLITLCAISERSVEEPLRLLRDVLLLMLATGGGAAAFGAIRLARSLTAPLERIAEETRSIDEGNLGTRLTLPVKDAELYDLGVILNAMLDRLDAAFRTQQRLFEAQRRFLADASHELRSPLANLRGTIEVTLRRPRATGEYHETLAASMIEIERLTRLVNDLLTLSRAEICQFELTREPCDLAEIARAAAAAHAVRAEEAEVRIAVDAERGALVTGDPLRLRQILDNLIDNALRYSPPGTSIDIGIDIGAEADVAFVRVRDEGPGLSKVELPRVFDRFYRVDPSRERGTGGLGLGLSIAKAFADAQGGELSVESAEGAGAVFTLRLPLRHEPDRD